MASRKVNCVVTGNSYTFNKEYFKSKVKEYGSEENLKKFFLTKKAKTLLGRGYSVSEIRNMLDVNEDNVLPETHENIKTVIQFHKLKINSNKRTNNLTFATPKSDSDVIAFINNIKD